MKFGDLRTKQLPWEKPLTPPPPRQPWLPSAFLGLVTAGFLGLVMIVHACSRAPSESVPPPLPPPVCRDSIDVPGTLPNQFVVAPALQAYADELLKRHPSVMTIAFGMDLRSATPLFLSTRMGRDTVGHDLALATRPDYPFASLAKVITSAGGIAETGLGPDSAFHLRGQAHTLYKFQLRPDTIGVEIPLRLAFAWSVNPVFGQIGLHRLGASKLLAWADTMGFNRPRGLGNGVPSGRMAAPVDSYNLAEIGSGFVRTTFSAPVQAAMMVRKLVDDGHLLPPSWNGFTPDSSCLPDTTGAKLREAMLPLFQATVDTGTAQAGFLAAWPLPEREGFTIGGKTGTLDGTDPFGRYEWFAGFARLQEDPQTGIVISVLTVNDSRFALSGAWTAGNLLAAWARHVDDSIGLLPVAAGSDSGRALLTSEDRAALSEAAWHRPWKRKRRRR
ncbi:MAG: hypothetical protein H6686_12855 [Fibrobacteria bacterium]|nr:hypothetical protein [Fibrobacteria bacterium]